MVIQGTEPWVSTQDLESGSLWVSELNQQLSVSATGIVCITQENKTAPWIHFEAGALAKGLTKARVCTFLIDLKPEDIANPLGQFNHTLPTREGMWKLIKSFNEKLKGPTHLEESVLSQLFELFWPKFDREFQKVLAEYEPTVHAKARTSESYLVEILENTRALSQRVSIFEAQLEADAAKLPGDYGAAIIHRAREQRRRAEQIVTGRSDLNIGQRVFHRQFGLGCIVAVDGVRLDIDFEKSGLRKILCNFVDPVDAE